jgi:hypothetical protein
VARAGAQRRFRDDGRSHFSYLDDIRRDAGASEHPGIRTRRFHCSGCNHRAESRGGSGLRLQYPPPGYFDVATVSMLFSVMRCGANGWRASRGQAGMLFLFSRRHRHRPGCC